MTVENCEDRITELKRVHRAETDAELAKALHIGRSTIASWRLRGSVPNRYMLRQPSDDQSFASFPMTQWSVEEFQALKLTLLRMTHARASLFPTYRDFLTDRTGVLSEFLHGVQQAKRDILEKMGDNEAMQATTASHLLAHVVFNPDPRDQ